MPNFIDRTGMKYGRLTVLYRASNKGKHTVWHCQCECGNELDVLGFCLTNGNTKSCGCLNTESRIKTGKNNKKSLIGQTFGFLTVVEDLEQRANENSSCYSHLYKCRCKCGNEVIVRDSNLRSGNTQSCGCLKQSHGAMRIEELLLQNNFIYKKEYSPKDLGFNGRFDFAIFDNDQLKYFIEYDGEQHFNSYEGRFKSPGQHERDQKKDRYCLSNNIPLIRIPYTIKKINLEDISLDKTKYLITTENKESYYEL